MPAVLKSGLIVPVYKRGGKDPAKVDSYRGVTLASVLLREASVSKNAVFAHEPVCL